MVRIERYDHICSLLREYQYLSVKRLAKLLYVSEATIRRDLKYLSDAGLIRRTFGGAALIEGMYADIPLVVRDEEHTKEKEVIAAIAAQLIKDGDVIIIDSSSTLFKLIPHLQRRTNTVITNSPKVAMALTENPGIEVYSTGGKLRDNSISYVGRAAENMIADCNCDTMFFSSKGIDRNQLTDTSEDEARLKVAMMRRSKCIVAMHDSSKFDKVAFSKICGLDKLDYLITDKDPGDAWKKAAERYGFRLLFP
ncbi:MAG: DeoR/GlpR family DNA-binding transcription regulator [Caldicoprobacterales bacterium]|jgi:DeoR/GlpR family transcriptional regulator of sugar metabolism